MNKLLSAITASILICGAAQAEVTPEYGKYDPRVRSLEYNKWDVTRLTTFFGVSTHIAFGADEKIVDIALGDPTAWEIIPRVNNLYIRPLADNPDTNLTIITDRRSYQFALFTATRSETDKTAWQDPNLIYSLRFLYADEENERLRREEEKTALQAKLDDAKETLKSQNLAEENIDYWVAGSKQITPTKAKDDGRFIYLTFSNNRDIPAIYEVDEFGEESLINTSVEGNIVVIHRMVKQLRLRKGSYVACVINRSFDLDSGKDNTTGTISTEVKRTIKGAE